MKVVIALIFVSVCALVYGEPCANNQACHQHGVTQCNNHYHVVCENHQCVCTNGPTGTNCTVKADCSCNQGNPHCVDNHCHCTRF
ncbi:hypothetical protein ACF0H5_022493 [Mactra antiquata]